MEQKQRLKELLIQLKKENLSAFDEFYNISKKAVYFAIYSVFKNESIIEDLMQETYIDFLNYKSKLDDDIDIIAFLVKSAKNKAINYYNKNKYESEFVSRYKEESYSKDRHFDTGLIEKIKKILDEKELKIFLMKVLGEYSFKEISHLCDIPIGTCTWLYQEARKKLEKEFGGIKDAR